MVGPERLLQGPLRSARDRWIRRFRSRRLPWSDRVDQGRGREPDVKSRSNSGRAKYSKRPERPAKPFGGEGKTPRSDGLFDGSILESLAGANPPRRASSPRIGLSDVASWGCTESGWRVTDAAGRNRRRSQFRQDDVPRPSLRSPSEIRLG